jgi:CheY-like chemotaxis protein
VRYLPSLYILGCDGGGTDSEAIYERLVADGHRVARCRSMKLLDRTIQRSRPDLVLIDALMEGVNDASVKRLLSRYPLGSRTEIVLHSPMLPARVMHLVDTRGALAVLQWPNEADDFMEELFSAYQHARHTDCAELLQRRRAPYISGTHRLELPDVESDAPTEVMFRKNAMGRS